jgi:GNAT superfamily N-acetyltransferase
MELHIVISASVIEDSTAIAQLSRQLGYPTSTDNIRERLATIIEHSENCVFTAMYDGQVVGWIHAFHTFRIESPAFIEIAGLIVDENIRGRNVGRKLVSSVVSWAKERGVTSLRVRSNVKRQQAHEFYKHIGFSEVKSQKIFSLDIKEFNHTCN